MGEITQSPYFSYFVIPLLICMARIVDVTLGTLRIIFISKGIKRIAPFIGFVEMIIWLVAIGQVLQNLTNPVNYFAYALGFSIGNFVGIHIEQKLAIGMVAVRIITSRDATELINFLREANFGLTVIPAVGGSGPVHIIFTVTKRSNLPHVIQNIKKFNPKAFYSIEDIRFASETFIPVNAPTFRSKVTALIGARKAK